MTDVKPYLSVIVLNVKSLDIPIKTQRLAERTRIHDPTCTYITTIL